MKKKFRNSILIVIWLIGILFSCNKSSIITPEIRITLLDDVSPTIVRFEVDDIYDSYDWRFDDIWASGNSPSNVDHFTFTEGTHKVTLTVIKGEEQSKVEKYFTVPGIAHSLKIEGIDLWTLPNTFSFDEGKLHIRFDSTPGGESSFISRYIDYNKSDTSYKYLFDSPVIYDVYEYLTDSLRYGDYIYCNIYKDEYDEDLFCGQLQFIDAYSIYRIYNDERSGDTQIMDFWSMESIILISDWMPE
jgi:hypothetical protein